MRVSSPTSEIAEVPPGRVSQMSDPNGRHQMSSQLLSRRNVIRGGGLGLAGIAAAALIGCGGGNEKKAATPAGPAAAQATGTAGAPAAGIVVGGRTIPYNFQE